LFGELGRKTRIGDQQHGWATNRNGQLWLRATLRKHAAVSYARYDGSNGATCCRLPLPQPELPIAESKLGATNDRVLNRPVRQRITFDRQLHLSTTAANDWYHLVQLLAREVGRPGGLLSHRLAVQNLQLLLIQGLLQIQPHNYTEALTESESPASPAVAKRAIGLMHAHPETPWSTADLARATGVSARALQRSFERSDLPSPMMYLRRLRLHHVHSELATNSPDSVTVTMVAGRWGFVHLGRFASQYRQLFGESPSETLRAPGQRPSPTPPL
jgi:AraC-like DNA-binding protein